MSEPVEELTLCNDTRCCKNAIEARCVMCGKTVYHHGQEPQAQKVCIRCVSTKIDPSTLLLGHGPKDHGPFDA